MGIFGAMSFTGGVGISECGWRGGRYVQGVSM